MLHTKEKEWKEKQSLSILIDITHGYWGKQKDIINLKCRLNFYQMAVYYQKR